MKPIAIKLYLLFLILPIYSNNWINSKNILYDDLENIKILGISDTPILNILPINKIEAAKYILKKRYNKNENFFIQRIHNTYKKYKPIIEKNKYYDFSLLEFFSLSSSLVSQMPKHENQAGIIERKGLNVFIQGSHYLDIGYYPYLWFSLNLHHGLQVSQNINNDLDSEEIFFYKRKRKIFDLNVLPEADYKLLNGSIKFNVFNLLISYSKEQLWFGPSKHGSLLMTNNAEPIPLFSLKTFESIKTPIGKFHYQVFLGKLEHDRILPDTHFTGFRFDYSPVKYIELGITKTALAYNKYQDYQFLISLFLSNFQLKATYIDHGPTQGWLDFSSIKPVRKFHIPIENTRDDIRMGADFRIYIPVIHTMLYGEIAFEDWSHSLQYTLMTGAGMNYVYSFGLKIVNPFSLKNISFRLEYHHFAVYPNNFNPIMFYTHSRHKSGYTHEGKLIGKPGLELEHQDIFLEVIRDFEKFRVTASLDFEKTGLLIEYYDPDYIPQFRLQWINNIIFYKFSKFPIEIQIEIANEWYINLLNRLDSTLYNFWLSFNFKYTF